MESIIILVGIIATIYLIRFLFFGKNGILSSSFKFKTKPQNLDYLIDSVLMLPPQEIIFQLHYAAYIAYEMKQSHKDEEYQKLVDIVMEPFKYSEKQCLVMFNELTVLAKQCGDDYKTIGYRALTNGTLSSHNAGAFDGLKDRLMGHYMLSIFMGLHSGVFSTEKRLDFMKKLSSDGEKSIFKYRNLALGEMEKLIEIDKKTNRTIHPEKLNIYPTYKELDDIFLTWLTTLKTIFPRVH